MTHTEFTLKAFDGVSLAAQRWAPSGTPKAVVNLIHGLGEHSSRYGYVAEQFTKAGYVINTMDLRGHGRSEGARGYAPGFDTLVTDIEFLIKSGRSAYPGIPQFLYGHSLGGSLVLFYRLTSKLNVDGVISTSPLFKPGARVPATKKFFAQVMSDIAPKITLTNGLQRPWLSRDGRVVRDYSLDPLVHDKITARMGWELLKNGEWVFKHMNEIRGPILMVVGSREKIVDYQKILEAAKGLDDKLELKVWEGLYHETHNEPEKYEVIKYNIAWLDNHLN
ncbi:MAG: lysophospholipase [Anaerolineaceae bacterium]|nr:lysophospholipase [Anaerolineaceae bacterium]MBN2676492.1 lysophospholipase [Anaerolineaceae bacterium]